MGENNHADAEHSRLEKLQHENRALRARLSLLESGNGDFFRLNKHYFDLMRKLNVIAFSASVDGIPLLVSGAVYEITGYTEKELLQGVIKWEDLIYPEDLIHYRENRARMLRGEEPEIVEYRIISKGGRVRWLSDLATLTRGRDGKTVGCEGLLLDVTGRKQMEENYLERQAYLDSILGSVQDVIWSVTPDTFELLYINPAAERVYGYSVAELLSEKGQDLRAAQAAMILDNFATLLQRGEFETEYSIIRPDGELRWLHKRAYFTRDPHGVVARIDGIDTDITRRKKAEDALRYISLHDALTGLYNRAYFEQEIRRIDGEPDKAVGLIICDIDGLKLVNDNRGHEAGDDLLIQCALLLNSCLGKEHVTARIGGDEFAVILENCKPEEVASAVTTVHRAIFEYNQVHPDFPVSMSVGWAVRSPAHRLMREVFREADNCMYQEKAGNRDCYRKLLETLDRRQTR